MAINNNLPISRLIGVSVSLSPAAAQAQNLSTLLILGTSTVIDLISRMRTYTSIAQVASDFGTSAPEYLAAALWFEQNPQPTTLNIGRWANAAAAAQLISAPLSSAQQAALVAGAIANGAFKVTVNGTLQTVSGISYAAGASMSAVAAAITTAAASDGFSCTWSQTQSTFIFTTTTTGGTAAISALSSPGSGTDLSSLLNATATTSGVIVAPGQAAETALAAVTLFDLNFGQQWYGLTVIGAADSDHQAIAAYIEAGSNYHFYGVTTQESGVLVSSSTTDIAYLLSQSAYNRTAVQYSSTNAYAVTSLLARILTTSYTGNNTTITLMYKQEPGIVAENLTVTQINALEAKNCNVFVAYNNSTAIIEPGVSTSGNFIDTVMGSAAFAVALQTNIYNVLYTSTTKIPQTDAGNNIIANAISSTAAQFVANGLFAPGTWTSAALPGMPTNLYLDKGYYLYVPPVASQSTSSRAARQSVPFQLACKLAGAVHDVNLAVTVNS